MDTAEDVSVDLADFELVPGNPSRMIPSDLKNQPGKSLECLISSKPLLEDLMGNTTDRKPYLYKTVEELIEIKSTQFWRNNNVRVLGKMYLERVDCDIKATLVSPLNKTRQISLDMSLVNYGYPQRRLIEVFGYFDADPQHGSQLKVVNIVKAYGVNILSHYKEIKLRNKYVPNYNDENDDVSFICEL